MSTLNVGAMAARLGLDTSDFLDKMKGVEGFSSASGQRIAAAMKQSSREGAESLRLIDEALGIHLSRPVTRIITQELPGLASALSSVLEAGVIGAVAVAGFEVFEKVKASIEKAQKAEEEFIAAQQKMADVQRSIGNAWTEEINKLNFTPAQLVDSAAAAKALAQIKELGNALEDMEKKAEAAAGFWNSTLRSIGDFFTSQHTKDVKAAQQDFEDLRRSIEQAFSFDQAHGTDTALKQIDSDIADIQSRLVSVIQLQPFRPDDAALDAQRKNLQQQLDYLDRVKAAAEDRGDAEAAEKAKQAADAAQQKMQQATAAVTTFDRDLSSAIGKLAGVTDPFEKLRIAGQEAKAKLENDFTEIERTATSALMLKTAQTNFDEAIRHIDQILDEQKAKLQGNLAAAAVAAAAPKNALPNILGVTPGETQAPSPVSTTEAAFAEFQGNFAEQIRMAKQAYQDALTPLDKYNLGVQELNELSSKGLIDDTARAAALQALNDEYVKSANHIDELQQAMQKLLEHSDSAAAGLQAFFKQVQITGEETGKAVFDGLNAAEKGAESSIAQSVIALQKGHRSAARELLQIWQQYFASLEETLLKAGMDKIFARLVSAISGPKPGAGGDVSGAIQSTASHAAQLPQAVAGGTLQTAGVQLQLAATRLIAAASALQASGAGSATGGAAGAGAFAGFFAEGGDISPGMHFVAGEAGAEDISLGPSGAHVTPLGGRGAGDNHQYFDMRGAVVTDDLMRRAEAQHAIALSERRMMGAIPAMQREINLRKRG